MEADQRLAAREERRQLQRFRWRAIERRRRHVRVLSARSNTVLLLAAGLVPLALIPLLARPVFVFIVVLALAAVWLARESIAFPLGLAGVPAIVVAVLGRNPFPERSVAITLALWTALAIVIAVLRSERAFPARALASGAVLGTGGLVAFMLGRLSGSPDPAYGATKLQLFIAFNVLLLLAGVVAGRSGADIDRLAVVLLLVGAASAFVLLTSVGADAVALSSDRLSLSIEDDPISLGRRGAEAIIVAAYLLLAARSPIVRLAALGLAPFILAALLSSGSRGPTLALVVGLAVLVVLSISEPRTRRRLALLSSAALAAVVVAVVLAPGANVERSLGFFSGGADADPSTGRVELWAEGVDVFSQNPIAGLGTGGFADVNPTALYPHNVFVEAMSELGAPGLLMLLLVLAVGSTVALQSWRAFSGRDQVQAALVTALLATALVNAQFSGNIADNAALWLAIGLAIGLRERLRDATRRPLADRVS